MILSVCLILGGVLYAAGKPDKIKGNKPSVVPIIGAAQASSASQAPVSSTAKMLGEDSDPAEAGFPFSCPQCGFASEKPGVCPICHIQLIEESIDSPNTENPSEDPDDPASEEDELLIDEATTVATGPERASCTAPVVLPRLR